MGIVRGDDLHATVEDLADGRERGVGCELAVDWCVSWHRVGALTLHIPKLVFEQDELVVFGELGQQRQDDCCFSCTEKASKDGDRGGHGVVME